MATDEPEEDFHDKLEMLSSNPVLQEESDIANLEYIVQQS